jgi:hypothetical protein
MKPTFNINVFPQVIAVENNINGIKTGKLNAATPAHTPKGTLKLVMSIPGDMLARVSP